MRQDRRQDVQEVALGLLVRGPLDPSALHSALGDCGYGGRSNNNTFAIAARLEEQGLITRRRGQGYALTRLGFERWRKWFDHIDMLVQRFGDCRTLSAENFPEGKPRPRESLSLRGPTKIELQRILKVSPPGLRAVLDASVASNRRPHDLLRDGQFPDWNEGKLAQAFRYACRKANIPDSVVLKLM